MKGKIRINADMFTCYYLEAVARTFLSGCDLCGEKPAEGYHQVFLGGIHVLLCQKCEDAHKEPE